MSSSERVVVKTSIKNYNDRFKFQIEGGPAAGANAEAEAGGKSEGGNCLCLTMYAMFSLIAYSVSLGY